MITRRRIIRAVLVLTVSTIAVWSCAKPQRLLISAPLTSPPQLFIQGQPVPLSGTLTPPPSPCHTYHLIDMSAVGNYGGYTLASAQDHFPGTNPPGVCTRMSSGGIASPSVAQLEIHADAPASMNLTVEAKGVFAHAPSYYIGSLVSAFFCRETFCPGAQGNKVKLRAKALDKQAGPVEAPVSSPHAPMIILDTGKKFVDCGSWDGTTCLDEQITLVEATFGQAGDFLILMGGLATAACTKEGLCPQINLTEREKETTQHRYAAGGDVDSPNTL